MVPIHIQKTVFIINYRLLARHCLTYIYTDKNNVSYLATNTSDFLFARTRSFHYKYDFYTT